MFCQRRFVARDAGFDFSIPTPIPSERDTACKAPAVGIFSLGNDCPKMALCEGCLADFYDWATDFVGSEPDITEWEKTKV